MKQSIVLTAAALMLTSGIASAQPTVMTDEQMDAQVAGVNVVTMSGNNIWTVTSLDPLDGFNNGGNGNTAKTAPGLLKAVGAGGLGVQ